MTAMFNMEIAGVNFYVIHSDLIQIQEFPASYKPFLRKPNTNLGTVNVNVNIELNNMPDTKNMKKIFETDNSWSMFADKNEYLIAMNPRQFNDRIAWAACFGSDTKNTVIFCSEMLTKKNNGQTILFCPLVYPLDQILLMYILSGKKGALFHAAGVNINGKGYIFLGRSGAGKSTISRQFAFVKNAEMLSDDRVILRKIEDSFRVFGTPWPGEECIAVNNSVPLSGIFFISHGPENLIKDLKPQEAMELLMPVTSIPWFDKDVMSQILLFCEEVVLNIPAYQLYFKPDKGVVEFLEKINPL